MFDLFGSEMPLPAKFFIAFAVVLALIGLTAWLVRRFGSNRLGGSGARGRQPRLAVIDAASVDGRRRLVLIRRDNVEHLLMIGGPTDVVVENNIVRATGSREVTREPGRVGTEPAARQTPVVENAWPLQPSGEPAPAAPAPRAYRSPATEEPWHAPEPGARPRPADSMAGLAADLSARLNPPDVAPPAPRVEPPAPRATMASMSPPEPQAPPQTDHNLAEMAQQLEAALRRTAVPEGRPPVTDPLAAQAKPAAPRPPARDFKMRIDPRIEPKAEPKIEAKVEPKVEAKAEPDAWPEPKFDAKVEPKFDVRPEPKFDTKPDPVPEAKPEAKQEAAPGKSLYDNLEEEMANLLGRPPGKT